MSSINYDLKKIRAFVFDVDGVLSCDVISLHPNGDPMRTVNIKDGYAMQLAVKKGYEVAIITGGYTESVKIRYSRLGVQHIYMRSAVKKHDFADFMQKTGLQPEQVLYVGDSGTDMQTAKNAGLYAVGVTWGFRSKEVLLKYGADVLVHRPEQILQILDSDE